MGVYAEVQTPILIIGFNRPKTLQALLVEVEKLQTRDVWITVDAPRSETDIPSVNSTIAIAKTWAAMTKHSAKVINRSQNLGIYLHCIYALQEFYSVFEIGIILEDDIQFSQSFISFVDRHHFELHSGNYWSICGHNPSKDLSELPKKKEVFFYPTHVHTIWGWAAHRKSINYFLDFRASASLLKMTQTINLAAKGITVDPFMRIGIRKVWERKIIRANESDSGGGWDNYWLLAGWNSTLPSLIPTYSLSRENPIQLEGQSHQHNSNGKSWESITHSGEVLPRIKVSMRNRDIPKLKVWGISRKYCWFFALRLVKWKPDVSG